MTTMTILMTIWLYCTAYTMVLWSWSENSGEICAFNGFNTLAYNHLESGNRLQIIIMIGKSVTPMEIIRKFKYFKNYSNFLLTKPDWMVNFGGDNRNRKSRPFISSANDKNENIFLSIKIVHGLGWMFLGAPCAMTINRSIGIHKTRTHCLRCCFLLIFFCIFHFKYFCFCN